MKETDKKNDIFVLGRKDANLVFEGIFSTNAETPYVSPSYNRVVIAYLTKGTATKANIPATELDWIMFQTKEVFGKAPLGASVSGSAEKTVVASTVTLKGKYNGRTPADVYATEGADVLKKQREWYVANCDKYPANKKVIEAIDAVLEGGHIEEPPETTAPIALPIYESEWKYFSTKNDKGENLIYKITVLYEAGKNYPVSVLIENKWAMVVPTATGTRNIKLSEATPAGRASVHLKDSEWFNAISRCVRIYGAFTNAAYPPIKFPEGKE